MMVLIAGMTVPPQSPACTAPDGYESVTLAGSLQADSTFRASFADYSFVLAPIQYGWVIRVEEEGRDENLARLTPPWHVVPNPRYIEGWHSATLRTPHPTMAA